MRSRIESGTCIGSATDEVNGTMSISAVLPTGVRAQPVDDSSPRSSINRFTKEYFLREIRMPGIRCFVESKAIYNRHHAQHPAFFDGVRLGVYPCLKRPPAHGGGVGQPALGQATSREFNSPASDIEVLNRPPAPTAFSACWGRCPRRAPGLSAC